MYMIILQNLWQLCPMNSYNKVRLKTWGNSTKIRLFKMVVQSSRGWHTVKIIVKKVSEHIIYNSSCYAWTIHVINNMKLYNYRTYKPLIMGNVEKEVFISGLKVPSKLHVRSTKWKTYTEVFSLRKPRLMLQIFPI